MIAAPNAEMGGTKRLITVVPLMYPNKRSHTILVTSQPVSQEGPQRCTSWPAQRKGMYYAWEQSRCLSVEHSRDNLAGRQPKDDLRNDKMIVENHWLKLRKNFKGWSQRSDNPVITSAKYNVCPCETWPSMRLIDTLSYAALLFVD